MRLVEEEPACEDFFYNFVAYAYAWSDDILNYLLASSSTGIAAVGERFGAVSEQAKSQNWHL